MSELINKLTDFDDIVLRNTPVIKLDFNVFDDLSSNRGDWDEAESLLSETDRFSVSELQYNAIDFVFQQRTWLKSRFCNGTFPTWYGSLDLETTLHETSYHWKSTIIFDAHFDKIAFPIYTIRTVFNTSCTGVLVDLRGREKGHSFLVDRSEKIYPETQKLGIKLKNDGMPGFLTCSARNMKGNNIVVFNKRILHDPVHQSDYLYEFHPDNPQEVIIKDYFSNEIQLVAK